MTTQSQTIYIVAHSISNSKGSTYGKASTTPSPILFQQQTRSNKSVYSDRVQVLCGQVTLYP
jgi:hypothetical protein